MTIQKDLSPEELLVLKNIGWELIAHTGQKGVYSNIRGTAYFFKWNRPYGS